jgi:hypothetical protein
MWIVKDAEEDRFFKELKDLPDRVAGLLAATIVEDRLTDAIKAHCHDVKVDRGQLFARLFHYEGPYRKLRSASQRRLCHGPL